MIEERKRWPAVEIVSALGVVASLVFVALEVRQNTAAIKAAAIQDISATTIEYLNAWTTDERVPALFSRVAAGEVRADFSVEENQRLAFMYMTVLRAYEARFLQIELGVLGDEVLASMAGASVVVDDAWFAEGWEGFERLEDPRFATYMRNTYDLSH
jgi:hypothetical protein